MPNTSPTLTPPDALVAVMIATSASDLKMLTPELVTIERIVNHMTQMRLAARKDRAGQDSANQKDAPSGGPVSLP